MATPGPSASISAGKLAETVQAYLADHPAAALLEDGHLLFDMRRAHYSISESHGRFLLQLWSDERNLVRTVIEIRERAQSLRLITRRMGAAKPQALEIVPSNDRRTPSARDATRRTYQRLLERVLTRAFLGSKVDGFRSALDLEHSFGPAYVRGRLLRGTAADAAIGVSEAESAATIDGILTLGILWLDYCRQHSDGRRAVEIGARSASEVALLLHGLEFARMRYGASTTSFARELELTFGAGPHETPLTEYSEPLCRELLARLFLSRHPDGSFNDALFRLQPERWLESRMRSSIGELFPHLRGDRIYSQVPALSSTDRGMLDLLALDRNGRLNVIELKADEDLHLPLQALDYWIRVRALNQDRRSAAGDPRPLSSFERSGYFAGDEVSPLPPRLILAGPALRIHPANEPVLRYLSPQVEWELIALTEHWRRELKVVFRKRSRCEAPEGGGVVLLKSI